MLLLCRELHYVKELLILRVEAKFMELVRSQFVKRELAELDMLKKLLHNLEVAELCLGLLQEVMHTE